MGGDERATVVVFAILKRLNDTRLESERRRRELVDAQDELARRQRLSVIGRTASTVFHQVARQHGAIGMFAHLLARDAEGPTIRLAAARARARGGHPGERRRGEPGGRRADARSARTAC